MTYLLCPRAGTYARKQAWIDLMLSRRYLEWEMARGRQLLMRLGAVPRLVLLLMRVPSESEVALDFVCYARSPAAQRVYVRACYLPWRLMTRCLSGVHVGVEQRRLVVVSGVNDVAH